MILNEHLKYLTLRKIGSSIFTSRETYAMMLDGLNKVWELRPSCSEDQPQFPYTLYIDDVRYRRLTRSFCMLELGLQIPD